MTRRGILCLGLLLSGLARPEPAQAESAAAPPDFNEMYNLIRDHLAGVTPADLNHAAVDALLKALAPKVSLLGAGNAESATGGLLLSKVTLFDGPIGYIRISRVEQGLDNAIRETWRQWAITNKVTGLVLDLRFVGGTDYRAAAATADLFVAKEQPLLDWGKGMLHSTAKSDPISVPVAILVNEKTSAAAEALAAALRETGSGLLLGSRTAGQASIAQEFALQNGQRLLIATGPIQLGDGSALSNAKPDISVAVAPTDERAYFANAFQDLSRTGSLSQVTTTNKLAGPARARRPRFNEAELVRERRDGAGPESELDRNGDVEKPLVQDPVLGRALDFLKGLSVVRQTRS